MTDTILLECRANFGAAPRSFSFWDRANYMKVSRPLWLLLSPRDQLQTLFRHRKSLLENGVVVWGQVVQANQLLFSPGKTDCPGELVYSLEEHRDARPDFLREVAAALFALKGTDPDDPEEQRVAEYLTNERIRVFGLPVPRSICPQKDCRMSTTLFTRRHLPAGRLCQGILPVIVNPAEPHIALPLPERYWPEDFLDKWVGQTM